jgi:hypothetical protein
MFEKYSNIKFYGNPSRGSRAVPWTDKTKLIVTFRNFANAPNIWQQAYMRILLLQYIALPFKGVCTAKLP